MRAPYILAALLAVLSAPVSTAAQAPVFRYMAHAPPGFLAGRRQADGMIDLRNGGIRSPAPGELAWFAVAGPTTDVVVSALDGAEFASLRGDPAAWRRAVLARYTTDLVTNGPFAPPTFIDLPLGPEDSRGGLTASVARRYATSTGDLDLYLRFAERDGALYQVVLRVSNAPAARVVRRWLRAFLDAPFGLTQSPLRAFEPGSRYRSPPRPRNNQ